MFNPGDVVVLDFPGVTGTKRRPSVVVSSSVYHASRPDVIVGLITSQTAVLGPTDYVLQDWSQAGLRIPSVFRSFFVTLPSATPPTLVGHLSDRDWQGVCECVRNALEPLTSSE
ncbi:MAG: type II toxin-antitoxin system PemK/MazF family toxin [Gemmatimonadetes bacterium]|nr:type II toxin-antitoxin system PemK/MazF family toxin [Gemmatimonadota bacterium]